MNYRTENYKNFDGKRMALLCFKVIALIHDNSLLPLDKNPYKLLKAAGFQSGQKVFEVGCGPGFYTIPAAQIAGKEGFVYAVDINPYAVERVKRKVERAEIQNVRSIHTNASNTGLLTTV